jgi:lipopolysaccharide transport system permease protein
MRSIVLYPYRVARGMGRMVTTLLKLRMTIWDFAVRDVAQRYRGSVFGIVLGFAQPFLMLSIYAIVFSFLIRSGRANDMTKIEWVMYLFCGLNFWWPITEVFGTGPNIIWGRPNLVKRVVFPLEALSPSCTLACLFQGLLGFSMYLLFTVALRHFFPWRTIALPLVLLPMIFLCFGLGWLLGAIGVFFRDMTRVTTSLITAWFFLTPIVYPERVIPPHYARLLWLNPVAIFVRQLREISFFNVWPNWLHLLYTTLICFVFAFACYRVHLRLRPAYADVL